MRTRDARTVENFGYEWSTFDQSRRSEADLRRTFDQYFAIFPWDALPPGATGMDLGCGTGRWARFVADRVGAVVCVDPSPGALQVAARTLRGRPTCHLVLGAAGELAVRPASLDFAYSLGVLHHLPRPELGLADAARTLKVGAPLLVYLYYALDNRPRWFRAAWAASDLCRRVIARLPPVPRSLVSQVVAVTMYLPLARLAAALERRGHDVGRLPLSSYRHRSLYVMRTDALDRLGTPVERRFTAAQVRALLEDAGLERVTVSPSAPYWCAVGYRAPVATA